MPRTAWHVVVEGRRLSAHVDRYSPLRFTVDGAARYSFWRIAVHNVAGMVGDLIDLLGGRRHGKRCDQTGAVERADGGARGRAP